MRAMMPTSVTDAQRRPESELRRHAGDGIERQHAGDALNEGRSLNSGDTSTGEAVGAVIGTRSTKAGV